MDTDTIERMLRPTASKHRPVIWSTLGRFSIDPPEKFCATGIHWILNRERNLWLSSSTLSVEFHKLLDIDMLGRADADGPYDQAKWYTRIDQEAWDTAFEIMTRRQGV